jgi:hypothetical protein
MDEIGWVIERGDSAVSAPKYWNGSGWSDDHLQAIRFARQIDASRVCAHLPPHIPMRRICQHGWG